MSNSVSANSKTVALNDEKALRRYVEQGATFTYNVKQYNEAKDYAAAITRQIDIRKQNRPINRWNIFFKTLFCRFQDPEYAANRLNHQQERAAKSYRGVMRKLEDEAQKLSSRAQKHRNEIAEEPTGSPSYPAVVVQLPVKQRSRSQQTCNTQRFVHLDNKNALKQEVRIGSIFVAEPMQINAMHQKMEEIDSNIKSLPDDRLKEKRGLERTLKKIKKLKKRLISLVAKMEKRSFHNSIDPENTNVAKVFVQYREKHLTFMR
ncbi:MAG: hypothetical protein SP4CHLAM5_02080 [Chlamydiia bacterium]|nr:hypothetical protein [Chlamydiia bacterium]MCH9618082.1 hypothetical protein [Chlamydiia bacterium]MCH9624198.1 hypothetical protein [Chlamydiia bacterium]